MIASTFGGGCVVWFVPCSFCTCNGHVLYRQELSRMCPVLAFGMIWNPRCTTAENLMIHAPHCGSLTGNLCGEWLAAPRLD
jgi:hypothetical protein